MLKESQEAERSEQEARGSEFTGGGNYRGDWLNDAASDASFDYFEEKLQGVSTCFSHSAALPVERKSPTRLCVKELTGL